MSQIHPGRYIQVLEPKETGSMCDFGCCCCRWCPVLIAIATTGRVGQAECPALLASLTMGRTVTKRLEVSVLIDIQQ